MLTPSIRKQEARVSISFLGTTHQGWVSLLAWTSLVEGGEGSYLPNCQTNLVIALVSIVL